MMDWLVLAGFSFAAMAAASTGAIFAPGEWYRALNKPTWTPPDWVFPVTWMVLYVAMVVAAWRVALSGDPLMAFALSLWSAQIVLNALWSPVFFGAQRVGAGMAVLVALWASVAATLVTFLLVDLIAGLLLVPYLIWVSIAGKLNWWILRNNPTGE